MSCVLEEVWASTEAVWKGFALIRYREHQRLVRSDNVGLMLNYILRMRGIGRRFSSDPSPHSAHAEITRMPALRK